MRGRNRRRGQALVPVLFIVVILTAFAVTVSGTARREVRAAGNYLKEAQAHFIARGAVEYALAELQQSTGGGITPPQLAAPPDTDANGWTQLGDGWYKVEVIDTASRVNINTASFAMLVKLPAFQANRELAAALVDWRDADDVPGSTSVGTAPPSPMSTTDPVTGAETDHYQGLVPPYEAKNAPFDTVDELLLVAGFTPAVLYGPPAVEEPPAASLGARMATGTRQGDGGAGGAGTPDSEQPAVDTSASETPLVELITTLSRELNVASDGTPRVNVKTASQQDMQSRLGISASLANALVQARGDNGANIRSIADLLNIPGFTRQVMQQIGDKVTVTDAQQRNGVININTAPPEVLATIPGADETIYNAVVDYRSGGQTFTGLNDLFRITSLNRQQLQVLVDHVCTKSSVYLVRVRVRMPGSRGVHAVQALVEVAPPQTGTPGGQVSPGSPSTAQPQSPRILQWREVPRRPGWSSWTSAGASTSTGGILGVP